MREQEAKYAIERKNLMQSLFDYLSQTGVAAELEHEPDINSLGVSVLEPVIHLQGASLDKIRLFGFSSGGCGVSGNILRFLYEINLNKELSKEQIKNMSASTRPIKEGKVMKLFGGKVVGVKWIGQKMADILNDDKSIANDLMKCIKSWNQMEFQIEPDATGDIYIFGPWFSDPGTLAELYKTGTKSDIKCCVFRLKTLEKIAEHIKSYALFSMTI